MRYITLIVLALALAACGSSGTGHAASAGHAASVARYSSAQQVVAALGRAGMPCTGGTSNTPVVSGASSETGCDLNGNSDTSAFIDVFPGTVTNAMVTANSVSTGTQQIFSVVGPNWWIQTDQSDAQQIQGKLGGKVIAGPWNPPSAAPVTSAPAGPSCAQQVTSWLATSAASAYVPADTNQQVISSIIFDAEAYQHYSAADQSGGSGQNFLTALGNEAQMMGGSGSGMPSCADPQDLLGADTAANGTFLGDAVNASTDTPNTSQASSDVQATISDLAAINAELKTTAPGVHITGLRPGTSF